jgi:hypothetical protein
MIVPLFRGLFDGLRANRNSVRVASCLVMEHMICLESKGSENLHCLFTPSDGADHPVEN